MNILLSLPILYTIIRLSAYGAWSLKNSHICGAVGIGILDLALIICLAIFVF